MITFVALPSVAAGMQARANLHVNNGGQKEKEQLEKTTKLVRKIYSVLRQIGQDYFRGAWSGADKKEYIPMEIPSTELELMKSIKQVFDPGNILNPGKFFP